jgi:DNA-binding HxlR family transcriptional regulator
MMIDRARGVDEQKKRRLRQKYRSEHEGQRWTKLEEVVPSFWRQTCSRQSIHRSVLRLVERGLVEKKTEKQRTYLKLTDLGAEAEEIYRAREQWTRAQKRNLALEAIESHGDYEQAKMAWEKLYGVDIDDYLNGH